MNKKITSVIILLLPLAVGILAAVLTSGGVGIYSRFNKPALAPPAFVFPVAWTVLYALMGVSSCIVYRLDNPLRKNALAVFYIGLVFNFFWSMIFFLLNDFMFAFVWLVFLWVIIIFTIIYFYRINKTSAYLLIPYLLWVTFAGYLNLAIYLIN